jgi:hypothetical protein
MRVLLCALVLRVPHPERLLQGWGFCLSEARPDARKPDRISLFASNFAFRFSSFEPALPQRPPCYGTGRAKNPTLSGVGNSPRRE